MKVSERLASNVRIGTLALCIRVGSREFSCPVSQSGMFTMMYSAVRRVVRSKSCLTKIELVSVNRSSTRINARQSFALGLTEVRSVARINQEDKEIRYL